MQKPVVSVKMRSQTDDLFDALPPVQSKLFIPGLIVCLVCGRGGRADMGRPLICDRCGADVAAAQSLVYYKLVNAEQNLDRAYDAWLTAMAEADAVTRKHYDLYDACRMERDAAQSFPADPGNVAKANNAERLAREGDTKPVFDLIRLWLAKDKAGAAWDEINEWASKCDEVLR